MEVLASLTPGAPWTADEPGNDSPGPGFVDAAGLESQQCSLPGAAPA